MLNEYKNLKIFKNHRLFSCECNNQKNDFFIFRLQDIKETQFNKSAIFLFHFKIILFN